MKEQIVYGRLKFNMPEGFHRMNAEELKAAFSAEDPDRLALHGEEPPMTIALHHRQVNRFLAAFADKKTIRLRMESDLKQALQDCKVTEEYQIRAAGADRYGFRYQYTLRGEERAADLLLVVEGGDYYTVNGVCSPEDMDRGQEIFAKLLESLTI